MKLIGKANETLVSLAYFFKIPVQLLKDCNKHVKDEKQDIEFEVIVIPGVEEKNKGMLSKIKSLKFWDRQTELIKNSKEIVTTTDTPYTSNVLYKDIEKLEELYPFIKKRVIGLSVMGKPIYELRIGTGEKVIHYNASIHANEWITSIVLMYLVNGYLLNLTWDEESYQRFYEKITLSVVPMINPDGVDLSIEGPITSMANELIELNNGDRDFSNWKSNINGVDLNDQFPALWEKEKERGAQSPGPRDYGGLYPLSEPESKAMANLTEKSSFAAVYALHTQGQEIYWGFEGLEPPISETMAETYSELSGYEAIRYVDSYAGYKDWFIQDFRKPGFTFELGKGENPLPIEQTWEIINEIRSVFYQSLNF